MDTLHIHHANKLNPLHSEKSAKPSCVANKDTAVAKIANLSWPKKRYWKPCDTSNFERLHCSQEHAG
eukprot:12088023-Karenia_brevis.AAC.1